MMPVDNRLRGEDDDRETDTRHSVRGLTCQQMTHAIAPHALQIHPSSSDRPVTVTTTSADGQNRVVVIALTDCYRSRRVRYRTRSCLCVRPLLCMYIRVSCVWFPFVFPVASLCSSHSGHCTVTWAARLTAASEPGELRGRNQ